MSWWVAPNFEWSFNTCYRSKNINVSRYFDDTIRNSIETQIIGQRPKSNKRQKWIIGEWISVLYDVLWGVHIVKSSLMIIPFRKMKTKKQIIVFTILIVITEIGATKAKIKRFSWWENIRMCWRISNFLYDLMELGADIGCEAVRASLLYMPCKFSLKNLPTRHLR